MIHVRSTISHCRETFLFWTFRLRLPPYVMSMMKKKNERKTLIHSKSFLCVIFFYWRTWFNTSLGNRWENIEVFIFHDRLHFLKIKTWINYVRKLFFFMLWKLEKKRDFNSFWGDFPGLLNLNWVMKELQNNLKLKLKLKFFWL